MNSDSLDPRWGSPGYTHDPYILANFTPRPSDVLIVTAPKAGTTWMQQILHQLRSGGDDQFTNIDDVVPWLERPRDGVSWQQRLAAYDALPAPRVFKTHCTFEQTPGGVDGARIVLSSRDPRDCCVSFYHHVMNMTDAARARVGMVRPESFDEYFERWLGFAAWYRNVLSWWPYRAHKNVLWLRYEDMKQDLPGAMQQLLVFLHWSIDAAAMTRAVEYASFAWMKEHADRFAARDAEGRLLFQSGQFIRKGEVGDYQSLLTAEHERKILAKARQELPADALAFFQLSDH